MTTHCWAVVGNPENRRVQLFQAALARLGEPRALELSYLDLLDRHQSLDQLPRGVLLRIDSPGENFEVDRRLLLAGQSAAEEEGSPILSRRAIEDLADDKGRILYPRQWFLGYRQLLSDFQAYLTARPDVRSMSCPDEIAVMFDKVACHAMCAAANVAVPQSLGMVRDFDELLERLRERGMRRVFVKLAHGSSASGVVAFYHEQDCFEAVTSAEMIQQDGETLLYNSLKLRRYTRLDDVRALINALAPHRVQVEAWLPKATLDGRVFDLRILMIAGEPRQLAVRTSRSPITNLHLGNRRGNAALLLTRLSGSQSIALADTCQRAAACFPRSLLVGLDVLLTPGFRRNAVLEANAFGDLLPGILHSGEDTYETQVKAMLEFANQGVSPGQAASP